MRDPRLEKLADVLVNYSVGVQKDQLVRISGPPVAQPLVVELYRRVLAAGGHPVVRMVPDELQELRTLLTGRGDREAGLREFVWALVSSREFAENH